MANYQNGYCCAQSESCPRAGSCTDDDALAPRWFKYVLCPNENECGNNQQKIVQPSADGAKTEITVVSDGHVFDVNDMCGYIVKAPDDMGKWDSLRMVVSQISFADVYVAKSKSYKYFSHLDYKASQGAEFDTRVGWQFYVVGVSKDRTDSSFKLTIWVQAGAEPDAYKTQQAAQNKQNAAGGAIQSGGNAGSAKSDGGASTSNDENKATALTPEEKKKAAEEAAKKKEEEKKKAEAAAKAAALKAALEKAANQLVLSEIAKEKTAEIKYTNPDMTNE